MFAIELLDSSGDVGFAPVRAGGRWVHSGPLCLLGFALEVVGSIRDRWVHSGSPWVSLGLSGVIAFIRVRAGGRWVHAGSLGSLGFALGVVWFALVVVRFMSGRWIHLGSPWWSLGSSWVIGFTRISPGGRWVHPRSLDSSEFAMVVVGFIYGRWVQSGSR